MIFSGFCGLKFCSVLATRACMASIFKSACARAARLWYAVEALAVEPTRARSAFSALSRGATGACAAEALPERLADISSALSLKPKCAQRIFAGRTLAAEFEGSAQISSPRRGSRAQILSAEFGSAGGIFSVRRESEAGALLSRHGHAMSAASSLSSAKFLKFSRAMYRNATYVLSVRRKRFGGIFKNFIDPEFKRSENFRGFKFNAWSGGSAPWSR